MTLITLIAIIALIFGFTTMISACIYDAILRTELRKVVTRIDTAVSGGYYDLTEVRRWQERLDILAETPTLQLYRYRRQVQRTRLSYEEVRDRSTKDKP